MAAQPAAGGNLVTSKRPSRWSGEAAQKRSRKEHTGLSRKCGRGAQSALGASAKRPGLSQAHWLL